MRLIDVDKLHYIRKWFEDSGKSEVVVFAKEIDKTPSVQAIPIEWIYENAGEYFSGLEVLHLYKMIENWEKENEAN